MSCGGTVAHFHTDSEIGAAGDDIRTLQQQKKFKRRDDRAGMDVLESSVRAELQLTLRLATSQRSLSSIVSF